MKVKTMWVYNYINQKNYILTLRCYNYHFSLEIIISIDYIIKGVATDNKRVKPIQIFISRNLTTLWFLWSRKLSDSWQKACTRCWQTFPIKSQKILNIFCFVGHTKIVKSIQHCLRRMVVSHIHLQNEVMATVCQLFVYTFKKHTLLPKCNLECRRLKHTYLTTFRTVSIPR